MLTFTVSPTIYLVVLVALAVGFAAQLLFWWRASTVRHITVEKPLESPGDAYLRDVDRFSELQHDMTPRGLLNHYNYKTVHALRTGQNACGYARMAASLAFQLYPDLRPPTRLTDEARPLPPVVLVFPTRPSVNEVVH